MKKETKYDLDGYEIVKDAILDLINQSTIIPEKERLTFGVLSEKQGFAMVPNSSSIVESEKKDIVGNVTEECYYPFTLVYRASGMNEKRKSEIAEMLDNIGKYLEKKELLIKGSKLKLEEYPLLTENRTFTNINRITNAYLANVYEDRSEDWEIRINARYRNKYKK